MIMSRAKYRLVSAMFAVLCVTAGAGCADDYLSLTILHNQPPDDSCMLSAGDTGVFISHGFADVAVGGYVFTPLLQSGLSNTSGQSNGDIIQLRNANVTISAVNSDDSRALVEALADQRSVSHAISGSVTPGGTVTLSFDAIDYTQATVMAGSLAVGQRVEVLANIVVVGDVEGSSVETQPFVYPITVTNGGSLVNLGPCANLSSTFVGESGGCFPGQDGAFLECCSDATGLVCPAVGTMPPP
jgi:hypothetical protein